MFLNSMYNIVSNALQTNSEKPVGSHTQLTSFDRSNSEEPSLSADGRAGPSQSVNVGRICFECCGSVMVQVILILSRLG